MDTNRYKHGKIYKITDVGYNKCYIGSTCESLSQRMTRHRSNYKIHQNKSMEGGRHLNCLNTVWAIVKLNLLKITRAVVKKNYKDKKGTIQAKLTV